MKRFLIYSAVILAMEVTTVFADFLQPLTDTPVGKTATGKGWLILVDKRQPTPKYAVIVFTDTGWRWVSAVVSRDIDTTSALGRRASITALVLADKPERILEVTVVKVDPSQKD